MFLRYFYPVSKPVVEDLGLLEASMRSAAKAWSGGRGEGVCGVQGVLQGHPRNSRPGSDKISSSVVTISSARGLDWDIGSGCRSRARPVSKFFRQVSTYVEPGGRCPKDGMMMRDLRLCPRSSTVRELYVSVTPWGVPFKRM